ncbi:uncharacterized protein LOC117505343 [Thalassophryne amazonica]|uniref:uncharacterized protein LOC117505343 n=1 Tax=Thalassophryne amazonica TaxID=390379 RepID=UPI001471A1FC|nr:uncharacterized protein LOC117505343 [Thalassophryne amazonica]XP_034020872.1 uncharacterized protein LOC117505343 [Thalassophryne amazonica]
MMKLWCCVCLFVSFARGQNEKLSVSPKNEQSNTVTADVITTTPDNKSNRTLASTSSPSPHIPSDPSVVSTAWTKDERRFQSTTGTASLTETAVSPSSEEGSQRNEMDMEISMGTTEAPVVVKTEFASWVVILLVFIIVLIVVLCIILYFLWRSSKTYSFDLRPHPVSHSTEPIGTFEPVHLDDLDHPGAKDDVTSSDLSPPSVANGTSLPSGDNDLLGENAPQDHADTNCLEASPTSATNPSPSMDLSDRISEQSSSMNLMFDLMGEEQQNENNNNPSICSSDPFVEINLDEPVWSDHLLTYPQQTSSVLPFSPYSSSSS